MICMYLIYFVAALRYKQGLFLFSILLHSTKFSKLFIMIIKKNVEFDHRVFDEITSQQ